MNQQSAEETPASTPTVPPEESKWTPRDTLPSRFVAPVVHQLQEQYMHGVPAARGVLAQLRRVVNAEPGMAWDMSGYLIPPWNSSRTTDEATRDEIAIHLAMTSYGLLQQSQSATRMHVEQRSLGEAARLLAASPSSTLDEGKVWSRLAKLAQSESITGLQWQLRGLISLLRGQAIGLDIARLADDLYFWQFPSSRPGVQRRWSRAFFARAPRAASAQSASDGDNTATSPTSALP